MDAFTTFQFFVTRFSVVVVLPLIWAFVIFTTAKDMISSFASGELKKCFLEGITVFLILIVLMINLFMAYIVLSLTYI